MNTKFLIFGLIAVFTLTSLAQSKEKVTMTSSISSSSHSSVTVSNSNESYRFRARFDKSKTDNVKKKLLAKLSNEGLGVSKNTHLWVRNVDVDVVFKCKLTKGRVKIYLDKDKVSTSFYDKIHILGKELKTLISGQDSKEDSINVIKRAEKKVEKVQRNLDRAKKELEKIKNKIN